jgi:hypothetical protein
MPRAGRPLARQTGRRASSLTCAQRAQQPRPGTLPPIRPRSWCAGTRFRWSGACTATLSGAVSAGSNPAGGTGQRHKFEHFTILDRLSVRLLTCGNADVFRTLPPVRPRSRTQPGGSPAQRRNLTTATRPLPARRPLLLRQYPQLHNGSWNRGQYPGAAAQPARSPLRPFGRRLLLPVTSGPHPHAPDPFRRGSRRPRCYGRMCRHARPRLAGRADRGILARLGGCRQAGSGHLPGGRLRRRIRGSSGQPRRSAHRHGADCPLT